MRYSCFTMVLMMTVFFNITAPQEVLAQSKNDSIISSISFYTYEMDFFPFQWITNPGARYGNNTDSSFMTEHNSLLFYQFVDMTRKATDEDRRKCIENFNELTSPKEKVLVLLLLHFSCDKKYLPFIASQIQNNETVFWTSDYERIGKQVFAEEKVFFERLSEKIKRKEPLSYYEETRYRNFSTRNMASGIGPNLAYSVQGLHTIGDYAKAILELWGISIFNVQPSNFTHEFWKTYNAKKLMGRMYRLKYIVQVETTPPEEYLLREREFIHSLIENEPPLSAVIALFQIYRVTIRAGVNNYVVFEILRNNYPDFEIPYKKVSKEDVWKLFTSSELSDIDDEVSFDLGGGLTMFMLISGFLKHYTYWFDANEMNQHFDELNPMTQQLWNQHRKYYLDKAIESK